MKPNDSEPCDFSFFSPLKLKQGTSVFFGGPLGSWEPRIHVFNPASTSGSCKAAWFGAKKCLTWWPEPSWLEKAEAMFIFLRHKKKVQIVCLFCVSGTWRVWVLYAPAFHPTIWANLFKILYFREEKQGEWYKNHQFLKVPLVRLRYASSIPGVKQGSTDRATDVADRSQAPLI